MLATRRNPAAVWLALAASLAGQTSVTPLKDSAVAAKAPTTAKKTTTKKTAAKKSTGPPKSAAAAKTTAKTKSAAAKNSAGSAQGKVGGSTGKTSTSRSTARAKSSKTTKKLAASKAPRGQQRPTPERYKQIEEALASQGYLHEGPTGKWGPGPVEALRNFQADHQLPPTGRLDSRSLIQLGLGPPQ